jgi:hypothetical protein
LADSRGVLFTIGAFIFGGMVSRPGVFFAPLIKEFGWSHTRVSSLASAITLGTIPGSQASARGALLELAPTGATRRPRSVAHAVAPDLCASGEVPSLYQVHQSGCASRITTFESLFPLSYFRAQPWAEIFSSRSQK